MEKYRQRLCEAVWKPRVVPFGGTAPSPVGPTGDVTAVDWLVWSCRRTFVVSMGRVMASESPAAKAEAMSRFRAST